MPEQIIKINGRFIYLHSSVSNPDFGKEQVLATDIWDYVSLWLRKEKQIKANLYWQQAREFYNASANLSKTASPVTLYYCLLNATKAMLSTKGRTFSEFHGISGESTSPKTSLQSEIVNFQNRGIFTELCNFLGEPVVVGERTSLKSIFYNLPFIHKAFHVTYQSFSNLFIPIKRGYFVILEGSNYVWFQAEIDTKHLTLPSLRRVLPGLFEINTHLSSQEIHIIRRRQRFRWTGENPVSIERLKNHHQSTRKCILPIFSSINRWYLKKDIRNKEVIHRSLMPLVYAAMHRLSELSRYDPQRLERHLETQHNWIISEFLEIAPTQFMINIACEITGKEFLRPYADRMT